MACSIRIIFSFIRLSLFCNVCISFCMVRVISMALSAVLIVRLREAVISSSFSFKVFNKTNICSEMPNFKLMMTQANSALVRSYTPECLLLLPHHFVLAENTLECHYFFFIDHLLFLLPIIFIIFDNHKSVLSWFYWFIGSRIQGLSDFAS